MAKLITLETDGSKGTLDSSTLGGGGSASLTEVEIDFGNTPINNKTFTIVDGSITNTKKVIVFPSPNNATGQLGNDWETDNAIFSAKANTGDITLYVNAQFSISGRRKIYYQILN